MKLKKQSNKCHNCIYYYPNDNCFYYPIVMSFEDVIKISPNHKALCKELNKNNNCQYRVKWSLKYFIKRLMEY